LQDDFSTPLFRGRDHGLPSYARFRQLCGLSTPTSFEQVRIPRKFGVPNFHFVQLSREIMSSEARANLQRIYGTPSKDIYTYQGRRRFPFSRFFFPVFPFPLFFGEKTGKNGKS
jgi:hypothetical protein